MSEKTEIEVKIEYDDHEGLIAILEEKGAEHIGNFNIADTYYDNGRMMASSHFMRIRIKDGSVCFTHKGPEIKTPGNIKHRPEVEFHISDLAAVTRIMSILGVNPVVKINKDQKFYKYKNAAITFDKVEELGNFVEVEADTEEIVKEVRTDLGLSNSPVCQLGYVQMMIRKHQRRGRQHRR